MAKINQFVSDCVVLNCAFSFDSHRRAADAATQFAQKVASCLFDNVEENFSISQFSQSQLLISRHRRRRHRDSIGGN
jgi:hypothetical protein